MQFEDLNTDVLSQLFSCLDRDALLMMTQTNHTLRVLAMPSFLHFVTLSRSSLQVVQFCNFMLRDVVKRCPHVRYLMIWKSATLISDLPPSRQREFGHLLSRVFRRLSSLASMHIGDSDNILRQDPRLREALVSRTSLRHIHLLGCARFTSDLLSRMTEIPLERVDIDFDGDIKPLLRPFRSSLRILTFNVAAWPASEPSQALSSGDDLQWSKVDTVYMNGSGPVNVSAFSLSCLFPNLRRVSFNRRGREPFIALIQPQALQAPSFTHLQEIVGDMFQLHHLSIQCPVDRVVVESPLGSFLERKVFTDLVSTTMPLVLEFPLSLVNNVEPQYCKNLERALHHGVENGRPLVSLEITLLRASWDKGKDPVQNLVSPYQMSSPFCSRPISYRRLWLTS